MTKVWSKRKQGYERKARVCAGGREEFLSCSIRENAEKYRLPVPLEETQKTSGP